MRLLPPGRRDDPDRRQRHGTTKKWRTLQKNPKVALLVDDLVSEEVIRIHPRWVRSWGLEEG